MYNAAKHIDPHDEIPSALRRAEQQSVRTRPAPSHTAKFAAVLCLGLGVIIADPVSMAAALLAGSIALWITFHREDRIAADSVESHFDDRTGLPLAESLPLILEDSHVIRSLTGRLAVAAIDVPEIAKREVTGDHNAAQALLAATAHRLRSHGWAGDAVGPFGPVIFLRRPGVFLVFLRDVLDERTTRWLAERVLSVLNEPVAWKGATIEPRAVMGLAIGDISAVDALILGAGDARIRARRADRGLVVHGADGSGGDADGWKVEARNGSRSGRMVAGPAHRTNELFAEVSDLARRLNETIRSLDHDTHGYLSVSPSTLCHRETHQRILHRIEETGTHGRIGLVVPGTLSDGIFPEAWRSIELLRRSGVEVHLDRTDPSIADRPLPTHELDGVIIDTRDGLDAYHGLIAAADARGLLVLDRTAQTDQGPSTPVLTLATEASGTPGPNVEGHADQRPQGSALSAR